MIFIIISNMDEEYNTYFLLRKAQINNVIHVIIINYKDCQKILIISIFYNITTITNNMNNKIYQGLLLLTSD